MRNSFKKQIVSIVLLLAVCFSSVTTLAVTAEASYGAYFLDGSTATEATFILDPGHGGEDPGALGPADENGVQRKEADDNLSLALKVAASLEAQGETVALTRITDKTVALIDRSNIANSGHYMIFCSLHRNSFSNSTVTGIETYYYNGLSSTSASAQIAEKVHENVLGASSDIVNRKVKTANYSVLRETETCSILIENLFISNPDDNILFDRIQDDLANSIAKGLIESKPLASPDYMLAKKYLPADLGDGFVASLIHSATGYALTNTGEFNTIASEATFGDSQLWKFEKTSLKNAYKLTCQLDGNCMDVASALTADGTNLMVWEDNGLDCQRYYFYEINGNYIIRPVHCTNDRVVDIVSDTNNAQIWLFDESNVQQKFKIVKQSEEQQTSKLELKAESSYSLDSGVVSKVKSNTTVEEFASNFVYSVDVTDFDQAAMLPSEFVGTGCVVTATGSEEKATVIVLGDVDGDGLLSSTDYLKIKSYFLGKSSLEGVFFTAADIESQGEINSTDYLKLKSHFLGYTNIYE